MCSVGANTFCHFGQFVVLLCCFAMHRTWTRWFWLCVNIRCGVSSRYFRLFFYVFGHHEMPFPLASFIYFCIIVAAGLPAWVKETRSASCRYARTKNMNSTRGQHVCAQSAVLTDGTYAHHNIYICIYIYYIRTPKIDVTTTIHVQFASKMYIFRRVPSGNKRSPPRLRMPTCKLILLVEWRRIVCLWEMLSVSVAVVMLPLHCIACANTRLKFFVELVCEFAPRLTWQEMFLIHSINWSWGFNGAKCDYIHNHLYVWC